MNSSKLHVKCLFVCSLLLGLLALSPTASAASGDVTLLSRPVKRGGFHFQLAFGGGGGPTSLGLWHNMEVGGTLEGSGITLGYTHVFLLSGAEFRPENGADMFGGHFFLVKIPLFYPELVAKVAVGIGESVDLRNGFIPYFGFGWHYGLDFHIPMTLRSGFTISLSAVHAITAQHGHNFSVGLALGYTWF